MALLFALQAGCIPSPNTDPCRGVDAGTARCPDADDADLDGGQDARVTGPADAETHPGPEAGSDAHAGLDATADSSVDAADDPGPDASGEADAHVDAHTADADATSDAGGPVAPQPLPLKGDLGVHDPTILEAEGGFTIFSTGRGVPVKRSTDLLTWEDDGRVFDATPAWIETHVPGASDLWAPDISFHGGEYHLYYSASTFGSRNSCIGHATATSLTTLNFVDQGPVICSTEEDDFNAIDPAYIADASGGSWLSFGSFWSGIKLIRLDAEGQREGTELHSLASRDAVEAIEAPVLLQRGDHYYLFVSFDLCCRGSASTYRIMVGRADSVTGPYVDADGKPMLSSGGGSPVVLGNPRFPGAGHNAVLDRGAEQYLVYHAYDAHAGGAATLRILPLVWDATGWPIATGP